MRLPAALTELIATEPVATTALPSEYNAQRNLHDARRARRDHLPEARVHLIADGVEAGRRVDRGELGVVEQVVDLPSKLRAPTPAAERDVLEDRDVPVVDAGPAHDVLGRAARVPLRRTGERRRIEPVCEIALI